MKIQKSRIKSNENVFCDNEFDSTVVVVHTAGLQIASNKQFVERPNNESWLLSVAGANEFSAVRFGE